MQYNTLKLMLKILLRQLFLIVIICVIHMPLARVVAKELGIAHMIAISYGAIISLIFAYTVLLTEHYILAIVIGILQGMFIALVSWLINMVYPITNYSRPDILITYYNVGFLVATLPVLTTTIMHSFKKSHAPKVKNAISSIFITLFFFGLLLAMLFSDYHEKKMMTFSVIAPRLLIGFAVGLVNIFIMYKFVLSNIKIFDKIYPYLKAMLKPMLGFFIGYLAIMVLFSGVYGVMYYHDHAIFSQLQNDRLVDFMYYSFSMITGLGFSTIQPLKPMVIAITGIENFIGLAWVTVVFAATLAYVQNAFNKLSEADQEVTE